MPITASDGLLTSLNKGAAGLGERVLVDYKDALQDYKTTDLPVMQMFAQSMTTDTGGDIDLTFALPSMVMEQIDEGSTPKYQHTKMRSERVSVKEYGIAVGVTRRMVEDSRFNEVELALNEARKAVDRHLTDHFIKVVFGEQSDLYGTIEVNDTITEGTITTFATNPSGGFLGSGAAVTDAAGRLYAYANSDSTDLARSHYFDSTPVADGSIALADLLTAIELIGQHGYSADTVIISPKHYNSLLKLADFTAVYTAGAGAATTLSGTDGSKNPAGMAGTFVENTNKTALIGQIYGLTVISNPWVPIDKICVMDSSVKPVAYVERRGLTVEEANPGFGIVGSYLSMRYGLKIVNALAGVIIENK
tara:strand:+ start:665 stop:1753 length:1089 start_codon:yes stop_codon:yes gene_type:complete